jgi:aspartate/methionine/tyrosine aminotransferase
MILSKRIRATETPPIPAARAWAARYQGQAGPALDLTQAVPGYPPPTELLARLAEAAGSPDCTGYGPIAGDDALRDALAADLSAAYRAPVAPAEVAITAGCNLAFAMAMSVLAGEGDAVLLPTPWYFNHRMALTMQGIRAIPIPTRPEDDFVVDARRVAGLIQRVKPRAVVLVTPNNPTGAVYPPVVIQEVWRHCREAGVALVLDETYRDFLPQGHGAPHGLFQDAAWRDGLVHLYSFSKAYCVPGHRLGAIVAGAAIMAELEKAFDTLQICPPRPAQRALAWAVPALAGWRAANRDMMAQRAAAFRAALTAVPAWRLDSLGAYFAYLRLPEGLPDAPAVAERLAAEQGLMTLPGPFFGQAQERYLRLAFANAGVEVLEQVPARLAALR